MRPMLMEKMQKSRVEAAYATNVNGKNAKRSRRGILCDQCEWKKCKKGS
jgi:hypothetical protein